MITFKGPSSASLCYSIQFGSNFDITSRLRLELHRPVLYQCSCRKAPVWICKNCHQLLIFKSGLYQSIPPYRLGLIFCGRDIEEANKQGFIWRTVNV